MKQYPKKINQYNPVYWENHRGGWKYVVDIINQNFHSSEGVLFLSAVENEIVKGRKINEPWVGVIHQVPRHYIRGFPDLERLLVDEVWRHNLQYCEGLFVISDYLKDYLENRNLGVPINSIPYCTDLECPKFDYTSYKSKKQKNLIFIGEFLRRFETFNYLNAPGYQKMLLNNDVYEKMGLFDPDIEVLDRLNNDEYDNLLTESIVFLDLIDAPANTTVIECLARNTPILINKLRGVVQYLGDDYPFYYSSIEEAEEKLTDEELILQTSEYLRSKSKKDLIGRESFIQQFYNSEIYQGLPDINTSRSENLNSYDISVVICSYNRVYNIDNLLACFCEQRFEGKFELFIWNNKYENKEQLESICEKYKEQLQLTLIHSTENYYCVIRPAMSSVINSDLMMICDDDVVPGPGYLQHFFNKYFEYGPEAIICSRGHVFQPHELNEEHPEKVWESGKYMKFFDESSKDRKIHFFHADNCLIPRTVWERTLEFEWESYDFILVDDYWLSYIISDKLDIPIWKIKSDDHQQFTPCADDENIALFHNSNVIDQRINFYIHHMRNNWPNNVPLTV